MIDSSRYTEKTYVGSGGMASVYKAFDQKLRRHVAIKELTEQFRENEDVRNLFLNEARKMALVKHQNVVQVYDIFDGEVPTIIMEYMGGGSLATRVGTGALPPDTVLRITEQVASGLGAIHDAGLVHRDIKPENILEETGKYKITDFGVAVTGEEEALPFVTNKYAAPEVLIEPEKIGPRSDIYSLGVMAAELLIGPRRFEEAVREAIEQDSKVQLPAIKNSAQAFWQQWVASEAELPPLDQINPSIPEDVARFITEATRRDRMDRPPDVRTFMKELEKVIALTGERAAAPTEINPKIRKKKDKSEAKTKQESSGKKKQPLWFKLLAGVGVLLILALGALFLVPGGPPRYFFDIETDPAGATVLLNGTEPSTASTPTRVSASFGDTLTLQLGDAEPRTITLAEDMQGLDAGEEAYVLRVPMRAPALVAGPLALTTSAEAAAWLNSRVETPWPLQAAVQGEQAPDDGSPLKLGIGHPLQFEVTSAMPGKLWYLHLTADNYATVVFPAPSGAAPTLAADEMQLVGEGLRLVTKEPLGSEWMLFIAGPELGEFPEIDGAIPLGNAMRAFEIAGAGSPGQELVVRVGDLLQAGEVAATLIPIEIVAGDEQP